MGLRKSPMLKMKTHPLHKKQSGTELNQTVMLDEDHAELYSVERNNSINREAKY